MIKRRKADMKRPEPLQNEEKTRVCLWCEKRFLSSGPANRQCDKCRNLKSERASAVEPCVLLLSNHGMPFE